MASSVKLKAEPALDYLPSICPMCSGQGMILYPFPGDQAGDPLGGVKIKAVTCLECDGSGQKSFSADTVESTMPWQ